MWFHKLSTIEYYMLARVFNIILIHNLLQTSHKTDMSDDMVHLMASLMEGKAIDVPTIIYQMMLQTSIDDGMKRGPLYGVLVTQIMEQYSVTFPRDAVTLAQGLPIDDVIIKRMEGQRRATPQAAQAIGVAAYPILAPVQTPRALTEVSPPTSQPTDTAGSFATPPTSSTTSAPTLIVILLLALLGLIQDIHRDFGHILKCFDCLEKKVKSMDHRLIHIEGIVDPSHTLAPRVALDILASEDQDKDEESDKDSYLFLYFILMYFDIILIWIL